jgi:hypothetical protein
VNYFGCFWLSSIALPVQQRATAPFPTLYEGVRHRITLTMDGPDFGDCSGGIMEGNSGEQYCLSPTQNSSFYFTASVLDLRFSVRCVFTPFKHDSCSFIYHSYQLRAEVPPETTIETLQESKGEIVDLAQRLYNKHFKSTAGYHFKFVEEE